MSCEINISAIVGHLDEIQSFFGLNGITDGSWLNGIFMSYHSDTLCMGYGSKFVILSSYYDKEQQQKIFSNLKKIHLDDENQIITNCLNFQIIGGANYVDWTCIVIGLSTGVLQFYSDSGALLYEKNLNHESVLNIRLIGDELTIFYQSCIIVYQVSHLIPLLKSLKEMFNKAKTTKIDLLDKDYVVMYKKWDYNNKENLLSDALMVPQQKICMFDHLLSESLEMGFTKKYRTTPTQSAYLISTGSKPYINFHSAREGFKQQGVLTDVAKALANKITSKLPSWLTGSQQTSQSNTDKTDSNEIISETLYPRHELIDYQRTGCNIYMSPINYQLAAITDTLGRIILLDIAKGIPIRMWKGYREAQCGFIEVNESKVKRENNEGRRCGLFLIIYAPRKAILEIWCLQKGPKVATFQCSKNGHLLYNNHMIDSNHHHHQKTRQSKNACIFFDCNDNCLKTFVIPFHCILSEGNSKSAEDFHHLKRIKMILKNIDLKDNDAVQGGIIQNCEKIQTPEIKLKCLELMTCYKKIEPHIIHKIINVFQSKSDDSIEEHDVDHNDGIQDEIYRNQLIASCENYKLLIDCYLEATNECKDEELAKHETIELMENEYVTMQRLIELMNISKKNQQISSKNVTFEDKKEKDESIVSFLSCFIVTEKDKLLFNTEHLESSYDVIGSIIFSHVWKEKLPTSRLRKIFETIKISSEEIMRCFLHFYLKQVTDFSNEDTVLADMTKFKSILDEVCSFAGDKVTYAYDSICIFWQDVREYLLESNNPLNGLLAAMICKIYALKQQDQNQDEASFEQVTQEECQWVLLTEKLNDVAVLSIFVKHFSNNQFQKGRYEVPNISLKKILNEGNGIISELVAHWLIHTNLTIDLIFKNSTDENIEADERDVIKKLEILKIHFPYSLDPSIILTHVIWITITHWSKNLSEIHYLKTSIEYLNLFKETEFHLKQGLCVMLWNGNFKIPLKATQKLINKTGRLPKEKLCMQNTLIPDFLIPQFLEQTLIFIDHFRNSRNFTKMTFKCEEILLQGSSTDQASLCELILQQAVGNLTILNLHYEMVSVLELIAFLNLKYTKPMQSLFDEMSNETFFMEINKPLAYNLQRADEIRKNTRIFFLKKAISSTIDLIVECQQSTYYDDHKKWIEKIKKVGQFWELDIGLLDRHHMLELYVYGYDDFADELFEKVSDVELIVKQLLDIAAKRLNLYLDSNRIGWKQVASGGALMLNYLETIHARKDDALLENIRSTSIEHIYRLSYKIFEVASSKNFNDPRVLRLSGQLLDASLLLKNENN